MGHEITATFIDGVLKPEQKIELPAGTRVRLMLDVCESVQPRDERACADLDRICDQFPIATCAPRLTRDELHARP